MMIAHIEPSAITVRRLIRNVERYSDDAVNKARWPESIIVTGTLEQARFIAEI